jgi:hypothetical protein
MLAERGTELGGPWSDHLEGTVWVRAQKLCELTHHGPATGNYERQV